MKPAYLHLRYRDAIRERFEIWDSKTTFTSERTGNTRDFVGVFPDPSAAFDAAIKLHPELMIYCGAPGDFPYRMFDRSDVRGQS
jgi:hypothetical protein